MKEGKVESRGADEALLLSRTCDSSLPMRMSSSPSSDSERGKKKKKKWPTRLLKFILMGCFVKYMANIVCNNILNRTKT